MSRRGVRLVIAVLFAVAAILAAGQYIRIERDVQQEAAAATEFQHDAQSIAVSLMELRAAEQAYVAVGQGTDYWIAKVARSIGSIRSSLQGLKQHATSNDAAARLDDTLTSLADFEKMDGRAREYARTDQRLLASDLVYADGIEMTQAILNQLESARESERALGAGRDQTMRARQHALAGGTALLGLFFLLLLAFAPTGMRPTAMARPAKAAATIAPAAGLMLHEASTHVPRGSVDLKAAADLCIDLARVSNTGQIPGILQRAASVLSAQGIVLWIADPDGRELVATAAHGYPVSALARMGNIGRDADNATAATYREASMHIVKGDVIGNGAIVAPLVTPAGAIGVMTAEIRAGLEQDTAVKAVAGMIAAQLATLVGAPPAARTAREAVR
jgi:hypothetical protein